MIELKNYEITPLCASGKEKYIPGAAVPLGTAVMAFIPDQPIVGNPPLRSHGELTSHM